MCGCIFWENSVCDFQTVKGPVELNSLLLKLAFQNISQGGIFIEKQTVVHIAFQNISQGSIFIEKQTAVHIACQNTVYGVVI